MTNKGRRQLGGEFSPQKMLCWCREFKKTAKDGAALEEEWNALVDKYEQKYPKEGQEFRTLLSGALPKDWEKSLPVSVKTTSGLIAWQFHSTHHS